VYNVTTNKLGQFGADKVTSTAAVTVAAGNVWMAIQGMWSVTVFATLTEFGGSLTGTTASMALFAGQTIYGAFTNFTLTSGAVRAYRGVMTSS
jgi:hypothetical protein